MRQMRLMSRFARRGAFTLVELMIVVVIVAILAMVAVPIYRGNVTAAKMSEGIAGCGTIRTAARVYIALHSSLPANADIEDDLGILPADMDGKYFDYDDYTFTTEGGTDYTIKATFPDDTSVTYIIDQDGEESGTFTTE